MARTNYSRRIAYNAAAERARRIRVYVPIGSVVTGVDSTSPPPKSEVSEIHLLFQGIPSDDLKVCNVGILLPEDSEELLAFEHPQFRGTFLAGAEQILMRVYSD